MLRKSEYAYLIDYRDSKAAQSLFKILSHDILVKTAFKPFTVSTENGPLDFSYGSLLIPVQGQNINSEALYATLKEIGSSEKIDIVPIATGLNLKGVDLGSSNFKKVEKPKVLILSGTGTASSEVGEVWHLFDQKIQYPLVRVELSNIRRVKLYEFNRIILASGEYPKPLADQLNEWVKNGGTLITINSASKWAIENGIASEKLFTSRADSVKTVERISYDQAAANEAARRIPTSIFETTIDITHPLGFGLTSSRLPVIRESAVFYKPSRSAYSTVSVYAENPLLNGFISDENLKKLKGSASLLVSNSGSGSVVLFAEDPLFRGIWDGTSRVFLNAVVLGDNLSLPDRYRY